MHLEGVAGKMGIRGPRRGKGTFLREGGKGGGGNKAVTLVLVKVTSGIFEVSMYRKFVKYF